jgi:hypothetical protein
VRTVEERLAYLEGRVVEIDNIRSAIVHLEERMDRRFEQVESRFQGVDARFQAIDLRLDDMGRRLDGFEAKVDARFHSMDDKLSRHFVWMVGIQVSSLIAMITAFLVR